MKLSVTWWRTSDDNFGRGQAVRVGFKSPAPGAPTPCGSPAVPHNKVAGDDGTVRRLAAAVFTEGRSR